ncbi:hypothetical protein [Xanthocytophaga agilis]|uniref:Uncharacterized protein n=1 Tax=Xanthocytophaga agilis TaxID=3048010 RepID=A0AAE3R0S8_9BACT|nr:hypothetical protein [Xanthocytophaga agilis]MDJ1501614.1 hypothetical protein [Xanthocytophaga agilis]
MLLDTNNHSTKLFIKELLRKIESIEVRETDPEGMLEIIENVQILIETNDQEAIRDRFLYDLSKIKEKMVYYQNNPTIHSNLIDITNPVYVILELFMSRFLSKEV